MWNWVQLNDAAMAHAWEVLQTMGFVAHDIEYNFEQTAEDFVMQPNTVVCFDTVCFNKFHLLLLTQL